ncbi:hypothetical protein [Buchananella hordeovulneris]|uniref:hypothetical protein n=1 Tax=Buchananella hordeovulneris TaxID=52770 RepID=UPI0026DCFE4E|nr:hypothetical protein [Buchananella hordeovulneris]MDO5080274.1 hypothetical protein [Buchananella hordeovulneris]
MQASKKALLPAATAVATFAIIRIIRRATNNDWNYVLYIIAAVALAIALLVWWLRREKGGYRQILQQERQADPLVLAWPGYFITPGAAPKTFASGMLKNKAVLVAAAHSMRLYTRGAQGLALTAEIPRPAVSDITLGQAPFTSEELYTVAVTGPQGRFEVVLHTVEKLGLASAGKREGTLQIVNQLRAWIGQPPLAMPS